MKDLPTPYQACKRLWPDARTVIFRRDGIAPPESTPIDDPTLAVHRYHFAHWDASRHALWIFGHMLLPTVTRRRKG